MSPTSTMMPKQIHEVEKPIFNVFLAKKLYYANRNNASCPSRSTWPGPVNSLLP